jgi:hypothetical protein
MNHRNSTEIANLFSLIKSDFDQEIQIKQATAIYEKTFLKSNSINTRSKHNTRFQTQYFGNFIKDKLVALENITLDEFQDNDINNEFEDNYLSCEFESSLFSA